MLMKCNNKDCPSYGVEVEANINEDGKYYYQYNVVCECGNERIMVDRANKPHFNIDEIALGTKRLYKN